MSTSENTGSQGKLFFTAAIILAAVGILRYFLKGLLNPLGVPLLVGSFLSSMTIVLLVVTILIFIREGRKADGKYWIAALWFAGLAVWYQILVVAGILLTERAGADTYFTGPWEAMRERFPTPAAHAVGHIQGIPILIVMGLVVGAIVYFLAKRGRTAPAA